MDLGNPGNGQVVDPANDAYVPVLRVPAENLVRLTRESYQELKRLDEAEFPNTLWEGVSLPECEELLGEVKMNFRRRRIFELASY